MKRIGLLTFVAVGFCVGTFRADGAQLTPLSGGVPARPAIDLTEVTCENTSGALTVSLGQKSGSGPTELVVYVPGYDAMKGYAKLGITFDAQSPAKVIYRNSWDSKFTLLLNASPDDANIASSCDVGISRTADSNEIEFKIKCTNLRSKDGLASFEISNFKTACSGL